MGVNNENNASQLGVNDHHQESLVNYMRLSRYKRSQNLRGVEGCFQDLKDSRLNEDTFTVDEVNDMLDGLEAVVRGEVESELINTAHTNVLLLRQLFQQAEKWHLKLMANISELENRELIEMIANFEESQFSGKVMTGKPTFEMKRLDPMAGEGEQLLVAEIARLNEENQKLTERLRQVEARATGALEQRSRLQADLHSTQDELGSLRSRKPAKDSGDLTELENQMSAVRTEMAQNLKMSSQKAGNLEGDLIQTKHKLLEMQAQLEMTEKELEKKFSQTGAYKNLKSMLSKKNDQIKDLRSQLRKYESDD